MDCDNLYLCTDKFAQSIIVIVKKCWMGAACCVLTPANLSMMLTFTNIMRMQCYFSHAHNVNNTCWSCTTMQMQGKISPNLQTWKTNLMHAKHQSPTCGEEKQITTDRRRYIPMANMCLRYSMGKKWLSSSEFSTT